MFQMHGFAAGGGGPFGDPRLPALPESDRDSRRLRMRRASRCWVYVREMPAVRQIRHGLCARRECISNRTGGATESNLALIATTRVRSVVDSAALRTLYVPQPSPAIGKQANQTADAAQRRPGQVNFYPVAVSEFMPQRRASGSLWLMRIRPPANRLCRTTCILKFDSAWHMESLKLQG